MVRSVMGSYHGSRDGFGDLGLGSGLDFVICL